jgi:hypothetical protein
MNTSAEMDPFYQEMASHFAANMRLAEPKVRVRGLPPHRPGASRALEGRDARSPATVWSALTAAPGSHTDRDDLRKLLEDVHRGRLTPDTAVSRILRP